MARRGPPLGTVNNPTGKGLTHENRNAHGALIAAGKKLTALLIEAIMKDTEDGRSRAFHMVEKVATAASMGDMDAIEFVFNRLAGKPWLDNKDLPQDAAITQIKFVIVDPAKNEPASRVIELERSNPPEIRTSFIG